MSEAESKDSLESAIADVYGGPLDDFIRRRDALAKELRSAGTRDSASIVKKLRKPSRIAWALDLAARDSQEAIDTLVAAAADMLDAQTVGGDVRAAIARLRAAVREFAAHAARAAGQAGYSIEPGVLSNAVLAVLGKPDSLTQLRRACLADVPDAGGLDFPTAPPASPAQIPRTAARKPREEGDASAARDAAQQARLLLADVRERSKASQRALIDAESKLRAAELRLLEAEHEARAARNQRDRVREEAETAAAQLLAAENAAGEAEQRLNSALQDRF